MYMLKTAALLIFSVVLMTPSQSEAHVGYHLNKVKVRACNVVHNTRARVSGRFLNVVDRTTNRLNIVRHRVNNTRSRVRNYLCR